MLGGSFSPPKLFILKSPHRSSETVVQEILLEYTLQTNLSMCLVTVSSSKHPNDWNVFTISSSGASARNFTIHVFFDMLKNFPPQSAPVKLWNPTNAFDF